MTGLVIGEVAGFVAACCALWQLIVAGPRRLRLERADDQARAEWIAQLWGDADDEAWLRELWARVDGWPGSRLAFDDHVDQALAAVADEIEARRLDRCVAEHPAGRAR